MATRWDLDWEGEVLLIMGRRIKVIEQLTEVHNHMANQDQVLTLAGLGSRNTSHAEDAIRAEPQILPVPRLQQRYGTSKRTFQERSRCHPASGRLWTCAQGRDLLPAGTRVGDAVPGATIDFMILSAVPGEDVGKIHGDLDEEEIQLIRKQLTEILEHMRQNEYLLVEQHPSSLHYDRTESKLYLVDFTLLSYTDPENDLTTPGWSASISGELHAPRAAEEEAGCRHVVCQTVSVYLRRDASQTIFSEETLGASIAPSEAFGPCAFTATLVGQGVVRRAFSQAIGIRLGPRERTCSSSAWDKQGQGQGQRQRQGRQEPATVEALAT